MSEGDARAAAAPGTGLRATCLIISQPWSVWQYHSANRPEREELVACTAECANAAWLVEKWVELAWQPMMGQWASWTVAWQPILGQLEWPGSPH